MTISRRDFIYKVAKYGGSAYIAMRALDLLSTNNSQGFSLQGNGKGKRIIILGAGLAGMSAAYEMDKLGYNCQILEARSRCGGRCWTVRRGTEEAEINGQRQICEFDEGLYFNPGPTRIPQHHVTLDYCRELGVPVEVFTNESSSAYYYEENSGSLSNKKVRIREAKTDMRGYQAELLAKAIHQDVLDTPLTADDKERMIEFLKREGNLSPELFYKGSSGRGYSILPSAGLEKGQETAPFDLSALVKFGFGGFFKPDEEHTFDFFNITNEFEQQMTMFQISGGVDQLAKALESKVKERIQYEATVKEIRKTPNGIRIVYTDRTGNQKQLAGDFCICTIPLSILKDIQSDFSPKFREAISSIPYGVAGKAGLQFKRRFWEEDDRTFGGITWTNLNISQIFYPSYGYLSKKGVLVGYYNFGQQAIKMGNLPVRARITRALEEGSKIHPQYETEYETGFSVYWSKIQHSAGGWASYTSKDRQEYYPTLVKPDDRIYLAGEHVTYLTAWMAGAFESARKVVSEIHERVLRET